MGGLAVAAAGVVEVEDDFAGETDRRLTHVLRLEPLAEMNGLRFGPFRKTGTYYRTFSSGLENRPAFLLTSSFAVVSGLCGQHRQTADDEKHRCDREHRHRQQRRRECKNKGEEQNRDD